MHLTTFPSAITSALAEYRTILRRRFNVTTQKGLKTTAGWNKNRHSLTNIYLIWKSANLNKTNTEVAYGLRSLEVCYLNNSPPKSETYRKGLCCMKQIGKLDLQKCALDFIVNTVCGYIRGFAFKQNSSKYQHSSNPSNNNWVLKYIIKTTRSSLTLLKVPGEQENVITVKSRYQIVTTTKA